MEIFTKGFLKMIRDMDSMGSVNFSQVFFTKEIGTMISHRAQE
jgi:hypothetical protein